MEAVSQLHDSRISAYNILAEMTIAEYAKLAKEITNNNVFQRKRVKSSKTVYSLLKKDLMRECVIPPIVLALTSAADKYDRDLKKFSSYILSNKTHLVILDGLQRTYTILDLIDEVTAEQDEEVLKRFLSNKVRVEFYVGLNRIGILYRMLTLNTGQTPMSLRQQIEILYLDYIETKVGDIELIREVDGSSASKLNQYSFKDVVEGFNSYIDRDELPIDKADILENINSLERLSKENQDNDLFESYLSSWHCFILHVNKICNGAKLSAEYLEKNSTPFGRTALQILKKPQPMSGFGAAVGKMVDFELIEGFDEVNDLIVGIALDDPEEFLEEMNNSLEWIKNNAKKIGNAQRSYFTFFFRDLFNADGDSYRSLIEASKSGLRKYQSANF